MLSQPQSAPAYTLCVPTYRRAHLLDVLLGDVGVQSHIPKRIIVVDGERRSPEVSAVLARARAYRPWEIVRIPSNHANLAYQRYLGWKAAAYCDVLVYLDDDLRIRKPDSMANLVAPFSWTDRNIAGVTANLRMGGLDETSSRDSVAVRRFGTGARVPPGELTPSGHRQPVPYAGQPYASVRWMRGGVMAIRPCALTETSFSDDLFALSELGMGIGEDTLLSRKVLRSGEIVLAFCAEFDHPGVDTSKAYAIGRRQFGYAVAFSRRLLNEHYEIGREPSTGNYAALLRSYIGNVVLNWLRAARSRRKAELDYALGFAMGAVRGTIECPRASRLTPEIQWRSDAQQALRMAEVV